MTLVRKNLHKVEEMEIVGKLKGRVRVLHCPEATTFGFQNEIKAMWLY